MPDGPIRVIIPSSLDRWFHLLGVSTSEQSPLELFFLNVDGIGFRFSPVCLALTLAVIAIYDAMGIRRQACKHAEIINRIVRDMIKGRLTKENQLKEVLRHTPPEALVGTQLGIAVAQLIGDHLAGLRFDYDIFCRTDFPTMRSKPRASLTPSTNTITP